MPSNVQIKSEPTAAVKESDNTSFPSPMSSQCLNKRPISLDLKSTTKRRLISPSNVVNSPDIQINKPLTTPDLEKILHFLPTPQPGLLFQSKPTAVTSEQEAFGKGFEEALHSLHKSGHKNMQNCTNNNTKPISSATESLTATLTTSTIAAGMSGGSFTYTELETFNNFPIKDEPQNQTVSPPVSPIDMETQEKIKLERKRQRNRVAASKCRKRKLERISKLEEKVKTLKGENTDLGSIVKNLKEHVAQLKQQAKIDRIQGADINALEAKIQDHIGSSAGDDSGEDYGQGLMDINTFISKQECECLNEADDHPLAHCLVSNGGFLQSDCDEQLILSITFNQLVKIHSLKFKAPQQLGPKEIKLFINQPRTIDFDQAESMTSVQDLTLDPKDLEKGTPVNLRYVKFQSVQNIQIFVRNNQSGGEVTQLDYLGFIGSPILTTKMNDFKRVAGKKGESH